MVTMMVISEVLPRFEIILTRKKTAGTPQNNRPRGLDALLELKTQYTRIF